MNHSKCSLPRPFLIGFDEGMNALLSPNRSSASLWVGALALAVLASLCPAAAFAQQADGSIPDVPDASVGQGGTDQGQEEDDNITRVPTTCQSSSDCARGFVCKGTRCTYVGYRVAEQGCLLGANGAAAVLVGVGVALVGLSRRRRR